MKYAEKKTLTSQKKWTSSFVGEYFFWFVFFIILVRRHPYRFWGFWILIKLFLGMEISFYWNEASEEFRHNLSNNYSGCPKIWWISLWRFLYFSCFKSVNTRFLLVESHGNAPSFCGEAGPWRCGDRGCVRGCPGRETRGVAGSSWWRRRRWWRLAHDFAILGDHHRTVIWPFCVAHVCYGKPSRSLPKTSIVPSFWWTGKRSPLS